jgi:hypothetical protein
MSATFDPFGNADLDSLDSVEAEVERALRANIEINNDTVEWTIKIVQKTGIGADLERWEAEEQEALGGRPKPFSAHTALVGLLLAARVHGRVNDTTICDVLYRQISDAMREKLGIRTGNIGRHETKPDYYRRLNHRFNSLLDTIDPSPWMKNRVVLKTEVASRKRDPTPAQLAEREDRLDSVVHRILYASYMSMPASLRKKWKGNLAIDGTPIRQFTRGMKKDSNWAPCDLDCGWYVREEDDPAKGAKAVAKAPVAKVGAGASRVPDETSRIPNYKKLFFGMEGSLAIMCGDDTDGTAYHPNLVLGMRLGKPGFRMGEYGTLIAEQVARRTGRTGWLAGDRLYSNAIAEKFQLPTRALGYRHVFDYKVTQLGNQATYGHAIQVEGRWYCDCMPKALISATKDFRAGSQGQEQDRKGGVAGPARPQAQPRHAREGTPARWLHAPGVDLLPVEAVGDHPGRRWGEVPPGAGVRDARAPGPLCPHAQHQRGLQRHMQGRLPRRPGRAHPPAQARDRRPVVVVCRAALRREHAPDQVLRGLCRSRHQWRAGQEAPGPPAPARP